MAADEGNVLEIAKSLKLWGGYIGHLKNGAWKAKRIPNNENPKKLKWESLYRPNDIL